MFNNHLFKPGYAIAEILLAMVIISISFLQLSRSLGNVMNAAKQNIFVTRAISLANNTMEEVMAQYFDEKGSEANDYALIFDGDGDYIDLGNVFNGVQTISFWLEVDNIGVIREDNIIDFDGSQYIRVRNGTVQSNMADPTYYVNGVQGATAIGAINQWYHVTVTTTTDIDANDVQLGKLGANAAEFSGKIDEVEFWDDVRTATEIIDNYRKSIANPYNDSDLKLYLRMNNGSGTKVFDYSSNMNHGDVTGASWTSAAASWSTILGTEGESSWSEYDDVDDFNGKTFTHVYYTGMTGTVTVAYVDIIQAHGLLRTLVYHHQRITSK